MKKIVFLIFTIVLIICFITNKKEALIPSNAIRIRIIANSDDINDQRQKQEIKNEVSDLLYGKLTDVNKSEDAKKIITNNIDNIKAIVNKYTNDYEISYGKNYFPKKEYKGISYDEGEYETLVIKIGEAKGNNFWCVLFPPLCMIDENNIPTARYKLYVTELLKHFN